VPADIRVEMRTGMKLDSRLLLRKPILNFSDGETSMIELLELVTQKNLYSFANGSSLLPDQRK